MYHYSFPPKFVAIIQQLYEDATCQVIHDGKLTEPVSVQTGVRQGCLLSPTIFLMVVDWVMRQSTAGQRTGIQWTFTKQLGDLDFTEDISLLSHKQQDAQICRVAEDEDIKCRINKARHAFNTLRPIWRSTALSLRNKIRIFNTSVKSVLLYGSETWRVTKTNTHKLQTFINRCLRNILNIKWPEVVSNKQLWDKTKETPIET